MFMRVQGQDVAHWTGYGDRVCITIKKIKYCSKIAYVMECKLRHLQVATKNAESVTYLTTFSYNTPCIASLSYNTACLATLWPGMP